MAEKSTFRAALTEQEREMPEDQRVRSDCALQKRFLELPQVAQADTVMLFHSMAYEVDTRPIIQTLCRRGKRVVLPRCLPGYQMEGLLYHPGKLTRHRYGMWEPAADCEVVDKGDIDLILVPALCYDRQRYRMGRGGGFYDRYLADYHGRTVGLCRQLLLQQYLPRDEWDRPVELVLTESELI